MNPPASRIILEVERAACDLRRGVPVILVDGDASWQLSPGEYDPEAPAVGDAAHPAVRLMKIAGLLPLAILSQPEGGDGLLTVSVEAIESYRPALAESLLQVSEARVPLQGATPDTSCEARVIAFRPRFGHEEHLAILIGDPLAQEAPYVRVHSSCVTGDVLGSLRCDCGSQLRKALDLIMAQGAGALLYLSQEGRGIGIASKLRAYRLQDEGMDTVEANEHLGYLPDERDFMLAAAMLRRLGLTSLRLVTNNPRKTSALAAHGIEVKGTVPLVTAANPHNARYLETKAAKMGHRLDGE